MTELLVGGALVALSALALRALRRRVEAATVDRGVALEGTVAAAGPAPGAGDAGPRGLRVGDVLMIGGDGLWLCGALRFRAHGEPEDALALFRVGATDRWVAALDPQGRALAVLEPLDGLSPGRVPDGIQHRGLGYALRFRERLAVRAEGEDVPHRGPEADVVVLDGSGGALVAVIDLPRTPRIALAGRRLPDGFAELLPGGDV